MMAAFGRLAKKMGWMQVAEGIGEQFTTAVQYKAAKEIDLPQDSYWRKVEDTFAITAIQTLGMGILGNVAAGSRRRSNESFAKDLKAKASAAFVERGVDKDTADSVTESIIKHITRTDAADIAITELEERVKVKKATKAERAVMKVQKKKTAAEKSKEVLAKILAPEPVEGVEELVKVAEEPTPREEKLAKLKGEEVKPVEGSMAYLKWFKEKIQDARSEAKGQSILEELDNQGITPGEVHEKFWKEAYWKLNEDQQRYFIKYAKEMTGEGDPTKIAEIAREDSPLKHDQLEGTERGYWAMMDEANRLTEKKPVSIVKEVPAKIDLPKQETTFIRLEPSENIDVPDVIVTDQSGKPAIFNPDIHILTNQPEARRAIENWSPMAKVETTRERRVRILREAGRIKTPQEVQKTAEVADEVTDKATAAEVVAIVKKMKPGLIEHISAMSKRGWSVDDFINDPDVRADMEGIVSEDKYYNLIMDIKEEIGALTSIDIFEQQIRDEQRKFEDDIAAIDRMKNEDLMQKESPVDDEYYDAEQHKWIQIEKEEISDAVEREFVEPPPTIEDVPIVKVVPNRKIFSTKVRDNTVWYLPKEEAMTQSDLLKRMKLDWNSDVDTMLHAIRTQTNVAYHTDGDVPFDALSKLEDNLDHFRKILSHSEFARLTNTIDSLRRYMVDVSDSLKVTEESISPGVPREPLISIKKKSKYQTEYTITDAGWSELKKTPFAAKLRLASTRETLGSKDQLKDLFYLGTAPYVIPLGAGFTSQDVFDALKVTGEAVEGAAPGAITPITMEKYNTGVRRALGSALLTQINSVPIESPINATGLLDFMQRGRNLYTVEQRTLLDYFSATPIRRILENVVVITTEERGVAPAFYGGKDSFRGQAYGGKAIIGFRFDYAEHVAKYRSSVGEDILHEITHALTTEIMRTNKALGDAVTQIRRAAMQNLGENDRRIIEAMGEDATLFHSKSYKAHGFSREFDFVGVYYGVVNNKEFLSQVFTSTEFQQYLASIPYSPEKPGGFIATQWDKFREVLSWALFNKPMSERETTLLDVALKAGKDVIDARTETEHHALLAYEARERSVNASTPRIKSIEVEQVLQNAPLKGSGVHAGLGTPLQQTVNIKEKPEDITRLSTHVESPLFALRGHQDAMEYAGEAIDALGTWTYNRSLGFMEIDRIIKDLNEKEREKVTSIMKEIESGELINLDTLTPRIKTGVVATRKLLDLYENKHKKFLRETLILDANATEARIFADVLIAGMSVTEATKKWNRYARDHNKNSDVGKIATTTYANVLELFKEWKAIENFGVKDYLTHAMRGSIALIDSEGKIIAFAQTKDKAVAAAVQHLKGNPSIESIMVDTTYRMDKDFQTLVSQKYYRAMKGKIAKLVDSYSKDIGKELAEKLKIALPGKGIAVKPQKVWSQFLQERDDVLPGEKDIFDILPLYVHSIEKKHAIDPYIIKLRQNLHKFSDRPNVKKILEDQLEAIRGQYTEGDAIVDGLLAKLGVETSFAYTRGLAATRMVITNLKLGYRPVASIVNALSGMGHVWVKTSAKYMYEAEKMLRTEGGREFIKKNAPSLGTSIVEGMGGGLENRLRWYSPLKMFQAPEIPNRELSFMTSYLFGIDKYGYDEIEAVEFAKRSVDTQEFIYSVAAIPKILRGPGGRTIGQFKSYLIKEIEFIRGLKGANQWAKYLTMQAVLGGPRGYMITLKSLPFLMLVGGDRWLDDLDTWLNNNYPRLSRGVFGFFGVDISAPAVFQLPEKLEDWAGVLISDIVRFGKDVVKPILDEESYIWEDLKKFTKGTIPIWRSWSEMFEGLMSEDGWILDEHGNNKYKVESWLDYVKMAGGFKPLKFSVQDLEMRLSKVMEDKEKAQAHKIVEQIVKRSRMIDVDIVTEELIIQVGEHAIRPETIIAAIEASHLDTATRQLLSANLARRMNLWQRQLPMREFRGY